jgi:hypothetical protein
MTFAIHYCCCYIIKQLENSRGANQRKSLSGASSLFDRAHCINRVAPRKRSGDQSDIICARNGDESRGGRAGRCAVENNAKMLERTTNQWNRWLFLKYHWKYSDLFSEDFDFIL